MPPPPPPFGTFPIIHLFWRRQLYLRLRSFDENSIAEIGFATYHLLINLLLLSLIMKAPGLWQTPRTQDET